MNASSSPEIGKRCRTGRFDTNYHDVGQGSPVLFVHGSGPGVSAWANWRGVIPELSQAHRVIAPDMVGFGYTEVPADYELRLDGWLDQLVALLDHLELPRVSLVGNSFGGAVSLHFARRYPERVDRLVLMGAVSLPFPLTDGLDKVWGDEPSVPAMRELMGVFAHNRAIITDDLVQLRYEASKQRGMDKVYESLFPAPRQRWVDMLAQSEQSIAEIAQPTLLVHGREDQVIPVAASIRASQLMPNASLLVFDPYCGHWTQIEKRTQFVHALLGFFGAAWERRMSTDALIGRWNIESWEQRYDDGRVMYPMGQGLSGFILYSPDGTMACFIAKGERARFASGMQWEATDAEKAAAYESIMAYGGRYTVTGDMVEHHVETSAFPNWVGGVQKRKFVIDGGKLSISARLEAERAEARVALLEWTRAA